MLEEDSPKLISIMHPNEVLELITQSKMPLEQLLRSYMSLLKKKILDPMIIMMQRTLCSYTNIGLEINGDIEPAPQNIPPLIDALNQQGNDLYHDQYLRWDGIGHHGAPTSPISETR